MYQHPTEIIAADIVLLPSDQDIEDIVLLNRTLHQPANQQIVLSKTVNLPHLTLLMGGFLLDQLEVSAKAIQSLTSSYPPFHLKIDKVVYKNDCASLDFKKNKRLQQLHEALIKSFRSSMAGNITGAMFAGDSQIGDSSITYINNFWERNTGENYWPHITLGYGKVPDSIRIPGTVSYDKVGLFHLGNHCTCYKSICTFPLT
ncbi:2'-5' RNA ligase family protein [Fulvivirgaceae bacterium BMA12]|uniref:2'-5' RNA ligase family protein n=1 Tax=Agaribacillus aureus TaxID=3051825 RepID=A0ABT8L1Z9_9BACT|nr:2'-5' RNA ligase family protein [Fulvivirgaceae bacterium BMA12]